MLKCENITKIFKSDLLTQPFVALDGLSLSVPEGKVIGFLGANGAGKTTLIKILLGITYPTSGEAKILGEDITNFKVRSKVGYLPENHKFPLYLSGEMVLKYYAQLSNYKHPELDKRIDELLDLVNMKKWKKTKIKNYSKGMMQRLGLAQAIINDPELIFLDEPTDGIDPIGRKEIRDILENLKHQGKTIFLNSHLLSEIELVSDRVAILNKGVLIKEGSVDDLTTTKETYDFKFEKGLPQEKIKSTLSEFSITDLTDQSFTTSLNDNSELNKLIDKMREANILIASAVPRKNSLEDMFISLINENDNGGNNE